MMIRRNFLTGLGALVLSVGLPKGLDSLAEEPKKEPDKRELSISNDGLSLIKKYEGFRTNVYKCPAKRDTIGYGHLIKPGEAFGTLTEPEAVELLRKDVIFIES